MSSGGFPKKMFARVPQEDVCTGDGLSVNYSNVLEQSRHSGLNPDVWPDTHNGLSVNYSNVLE